MNRSETDSPGWDAFLASIQNDSALLAAAARTDMSAEIPTCPGWLMRDLLLHLGRIHREKESTVRLSLRDKDFTFEKPSENLVEWFEEGSALMLEAFRGKSPSDHAWTWHKPDQTVGFWIRRMAHETLIHRVDGELAHGPSTPINPEIAKDGIDEALTIFIEGYPPWASLNRDSSVIRLTTGDRSWHLRKADFSGTSRSGRVFENFPTVLLEPDQSEPDCVISGEPAALNLWLWGRGPISELEVTGEASLAQYLRDIAAKST